MDYLIKDIKIEVFPTEAKTLIDYMDSYFANYPNKNELDIFQLTANYVLDSIYSKLMTVRKSRKQRTIKLSYVELETINLILNKNQEGYRHASYFFTQIDTKSSSRFRWAEEKGKQKLLPAAKLQLAEVNEEY